MKMFVYLVKYFTIMITGELIKYIGITSVYQFPHFVLIPFNLVAILFSIGYFTKNNYKEKFNLLQTIIIIVITSTLDIILIYNSNPSNISYLIITLSNVIESLLLIYEK